jgi:2,3-dihydroxybenzoate decarboxylase
VPLDFKDRPSTDHFQSTYKFSPSFVRDVGNRLCVGHASLVRRIRDVTGPMSTSASRPWTNACVHLAARRAGGQVPVQGVAAQILSLSEPGTQGFRTDELDKAKDFARRANDWMNDAYCKKYPKRFFGLACVPTQNAQAAADELEYAVQTLGFKGCLINGATPTTKHDHEDFIYLDDPSYDVFWAKAEELGVAVFIHPRAPALKYMPLGHKVRLMLPI